MHCPSRAARRLGSELLSADPAPSLAAAATAGSAQTRPPPPQLAPALLPPCCAAIVACPCTQALAPCVWQALVVSGDSRRCDEVLAQLALLHNSVRPHCCRSLQWDMLSETAGHLGDSGSSKMWTNRLFFSSCGFSGPSKLAFSALPSFWHRPLLLGALLVWNIGATMAGATRISPSIPCASHHMLSKLLPLTLHCVPLSTVTTQAREGHKSAIDSANLLGNIGFLASCHRAT